MGIDRHVSGCATQTLALSVRDMLFCFRISILFGHSKVDNVDDIGGFGTRSTDEEVVGLDVSVDEVTVMDRLYTGELSSDLVDNKTHHLFGDHTACLDREFPPTHVKQVF
jgi:hypothetical protein